MSFVASGNGSVAAEEISNDGFFPDVDPEDFRSVMREDKTVPNDRLRAMLIEAIISTNRELAPLRSAHPQLGSLEDVPAPQVGGESVLIHRYKRAIYSMAKADLMERFVDYDATNSGSTQGEQKQLTADDHRRNARWAVSDLLGTSRSKVELI